MAARLRSAGLSLPASAPPSFVLGAVEATPLQLAEAYTTFGGQPGQRIRPVALSRLEEASGLSLGRPRAVKRTVSSRSSAWAVRANMAAVLDRGTGRGARVKGQPLHGKTGTSSGLRDAWFVAEMDGLIVVTWVGLDGGGRLGLTGSQAAVPMFRRWAKGTHRLGPDLEPLGPAGAHEVWIDPNSGWSTEPGTKGALPMVFRGRQYPGKKRFWKSGKSSVLK